MIGPIGLTVLFLVSFTLVLVLYLWLDEFFSLRQVMGYIDGPRTYPFIGLSRQFSRVAVKERFKWFNDLCFAYKYGMVVTWFGLEPIVNIRKPHQIEIILKSYNYVRKTKLYKTIKPWLGDGLLLSTGEQWFNHRRILASAFHKDVVKNLYISVMYEKVEILTESINKKVTDSPKSPINVFDLISKFSTDTICESAMGIHVDTQRKTGNYYTEVLNSFCRMSVERFYGFLHKFDFFFYRTTVGKDFLRDVQVMHIFTEKVIQEEQERRSETKIEINEDAPTHIFNSTEKRKTVFIDYLLDSNEKSENPLTLEELRQEIDTFIFTGHSTTATALSWALFALGNAPEVQAKVHEELRSVFDEHNEPATINELQRLEYLDRVIKEVLRLYPSFPTIGRHLENDVVIDNRYIPAGTMMNIQIYQLHREPDIWKNPETFDPDRFLPENVNDRPEYSYIPFSSGPRNCIGQDFALLTMKIALTAILRKWRIKSALEPSKIDMTVNNFTLRPFDDVIEIYFSPL